MQTVVACGRERSGRRGGAWLLACVGRRGGAWLFASVGLALGALACSSDDDSGECQPLCDMVQSCNTRASDASCQSWCRDVQRQAQVRGEVMHEMGECAKAMGCGMLASGDYWPPCWQAMRPQIRATEGSVAFCELVSEREFGCGYTADVMACVENMKYFEQTLLDRAAGCVVAPTCDDVEACLANTFSLPRPPVGPRPRRSSVRGSARGLRRRRRCRAGRPLCHAGSARWVRVALVRGV